ncbi:NAD(P)/FAD-dependent oxidoreductase [Cumulibacter manganitolerans]|uniref:NAD(P)/FAD-dependent oxidoreductase n=1 Tax=Cumulibacter manganitolerans TaxID=1884992 RepID=UPI001295F032|nr:FAD-dependent monooxygenase [Cumulibacter manganitolerans]
MSVDLLVVGGGPVGLVTALLASRAGLSAEVVEARRPPIDKACGEGLMPAGVARLAALGIDPPGMPIRGIRYQAGEQAAEARFRGGPGRGVRRTVLMAELDRAASEHGVPVRRGTVVGVVAGPSAVTVHLRDGAARTAAYVVGADGLHSTLRRLSGLGSGDPRVRAAGGGRRWGVRQHFAVPPWSELVEVHWARHAEAYVTPVANDLVGVAVLSARRAPFATQLAWFPELRERLVAAEAGRPRGAGPLRQRTLARSRGRVALVGDAAGYVDALTGEGLSVGFAQAAELVDALRRGSLRDYERRWRRVVRRSSLLTGGLLAASRFPPSRRLIVPAAQRLPAVFGALVNTAARG